MHLTLWCAKLACTAIFSAQKTSDEAEGLSVRLNRDIAVLQQTGAITDYALQFLAQKMCWQDDVFGTRE
jgi:hypothetical protein